MPGANYLRVRKMRRIIAGTAAALLAAVLFLPVPCRGVSAKKAYVLDAVSGRVLYEKDSADQSLIASTTKIMTALVVCEQCNVLDRMRIPKEAVGIEGSSMYLKEGEVLTIQELLYGLMLSSGNDAAVALAIYCGGTVEGFVGMMNDKARVLGLTGTHFENPNGLDAPGHYSTARDLAVLAAYAMENPIFYKTVSAKSVKIGERCLTNHNKLLWQVEGADGVKTGFTKAAGRILVSSATRDGRPACWRRASPAIPPRGSSPPETRWVPWRWRGAKINGCRCWRRRILSMPCPRRSGLSWCFPARDLCTPRQWRARRPDGSM